jgi:hypothetical protein
VPLPIVQHFVVKLIMIAMKGNLHGVEGVVAAAAAGGGGDGGGGRIAVPG